MASNELFILDVGHGNCAIIQHGEEAIVVDAPAKPVVARMLDELEIKSISALVLSHADADHISGAIPLILNQERPVSRVFVNPDRRKNKLWDSFRRAVAAAGSGPANRPVVQPSISTSDSGRICLAGTTLQILHPQPEMCLTGIGGIDVDGEEVTANNMSAVVLVEHNGERVCLLAGDADQRSLERMIASNADLRAKVLVFPHHGGRGTTGDNRSFAKDFVSAVNPAVVVFSLGRGFHGTPRPEIIAGTREAINLQPAPYIACTQLSNRCSAAPLSRNKQGLDPRSDGFKNDKCCAGTLTLSLADQDLVGFLSDLEKNHGGFVAKEVPNALCRRC